MEEHEAALEPPLKKIKSGVISVMGDKQKALRSVALGGVPASLAEHAVQAAKSAGQVCIVVCKLEGKFLALVTIHTGCKLLDVRPCSALPHHLKQ